MSESRSGGKKNRYKRHLRGVASRFCRASAVYELIYLLAGGTTAIIALVAIWAARSPVHWFWRAAALLTCFALLVPIGAAELNLLFAPMAGLLFLTAVVQQWWDKRKARAAAMAESSAEDLKKPKVRFSLRELFLVILLAAVAAWIIAYVVQEGIILDSRKLPIAVVLVTVVAWLAATWPEKPRTWRPGFAIPIAYMLGFAMAVWLIYAIPYWFNWHSTMHIAIATVIFSLATIVVVYLWLVYVGRIRQTVTVAAAIGGAAYAHLNYLGDWLQADYLLVQRWPPFAYDWGFLYGIVYSLLAVFAILGALLVKGAALPSRDSRRNFILSWLSISALVSLLLPLAWQYWQLLEVPGYQSRSTAMTVNSLPDANRILLELRQALKVAEENALEAGKTFSMNDAPEVQRLTRELFIVLEKPGSVSRQWDTPEHDADVEHQISVAWGMLEISAELLGRNGDPPNDDYDAWSDYALAWARYANYSQRGALAREAWQGYVMETGGHIWLAQNRQRLSLARQRDLLAALRELDRTREPIDVTLAREAAYSEKHDRWRGRLQRVVLKVEARSVDPIVRVRNMPSVRSMHDRCVMFARLNMTEMAIELFQKDERRTPSSLQELVPRYLESVPTDPYSGQAIVYRPTNDKYLLYSIGPDGKDDGGNVAMLHFNYYWSPYRYPYDGDIVLDVLLQKLEASLAKANATVPTANTTKAPAAPQSGGNSTTPASP